MLLNILAKLKKKYVIGLPTHNFFPNFHQNIIEQQKQLTFANQEQNVCASIILEINVN